MTLLCECDHAIRNVKAFCRETMTDQQVDDPTAASTADVERVSPALQKRNCSFMLFNPIGPLKFVAIPPIGNLVVAFRDFVRCHWGSLMVIRVHVEDSINLGYGSSAAILAQYTWVTAGG